jgi:hypothetical protein
MIKESISGVIRESISGVKESIREEYENDFEEASYTSSI